MVPGCDVDVSFQRGRGGGTTEVGAPASGGSTGFAHALTPQLNNSIVLVLGPVLSRHGNS